MLDLLLELFDDVRQWIRGALLGLANSVFHRLITRSFRPGSPRPVSAARFRSTPFPAFLGTAIAPVTMLAVAASLGLNFAVIVAGSIALVAALPLMLVRGGDNFPAAPHPK